MYGLALIAILAVMGGAIAYIGDKLGTKVGKKKLSIFGLRPKHTSIIVTIVTGILIAGSTLGILALTSRDVRTALFGMEALKAELSTLSQEVTAKSKELEASHDALEAKNAEYATLNAKVKETAARLATISQELTSVAAERDRTAAALAQVQEDYAQAKGDLTQSRNQISVLQATKTQLDARVAALSTEESSLRSDVNRLNDLTTNLKKGIQVVREGVVVFRAGEMLSTSVIKGGQSLEETEKALATVISNTNRDVLDKLDVSDKSLDVIWIGKNDVQQAATLIASNPEDIIVRISSVGNIVYGEPVISRIDLFPNRLVYSQGDVVHSEVINESTNTRQAEESVLLFLQKVNAAAIKQGILPDPLQRTVGVMSGAQLYDTVNKVKRYGDKVELVAVAKNDIYTVGPLQIEIHVRKAL